MVFEPLWSRQHIKSVQILWAEKQGTEGRGGYFDNFGIIRDIMQNHLLQILALFAMEPPVTLDAEDIRNEKVKVSEGREGWKDRGHVIGEHSRLGPVALSPSFLSWRVSEPPSSTPYPLPPTLLCAPPPPFSAGAARHAPRVAGRHRPGAVRPLPARRPRAAAGVLGRPHGAQGVALPDLRVRGALHRQPALGGRALPHAGGQGGGQKRMRGARARGRAGVVGGGMHVAQGGAGRWALFMQAGKAVDRKG